MNVLERYVPTIITKISCMADVNGIIPRAITYIIVRKLVMKILKDDVPVACIELSPFKFVF